MKEKTTNKVLNLLKKREFDLAINTLETEEGPKALGLLITCYRVSGKFIKEHEASQRFCQKYPDGKTLKKDERKYLEGARKTLALFEKCGLHEYNIQITDYFSLQSKERADESYPESDDVNNVLIERNEDLTRQFIQKIQRDKTSSDVELREKAFFSAAELYKNMQKYDYAFYHYYQAIKLNPNKAVYWGYASYALCMDVRLKKDYHGTICSAYLSRIFGQKAVELDINNARWRHYYALALSLFANQDPIYIHQVITDIKKALSLCIPDQIPLKRDLMEFLSQAEALERRI